MAKKGLVFLHFIWSKYLTKFWNGNLTVHEGWGGGGILAEKFCQYKSPKSVVDGP